MTSFFLKLLGLDSADAEAVSGMSFHLRPAVPWLAIGLAAAFLIFVAWWLYRSTPKDVAPGRRRLMTALRTIFFLLLLGIILRPILSLSVEREARRTLVTLVDSSSSMGIADPRENPDDRARAAIASGDLAPDAGLGTAPAEGAEPVTRQSLASDVLSNEQLGLVAKLGEKADVAAYQFGAGIEGFSLDSAQIVSESPSTALGDALREVLRRRGADDLAGIFLISDGANNEGPSPLIAASALRERGIPVFAYGIGVTDSKDIAVSGIEMPDVALAEDGVTVTVLVDGRGVREGEVGQLTLKLAGATVAEQEFAFTGKGEQEVTAFFVPKQVGEFPVEALVEGAGGEVLNDNNSITQNIRVIDSAIRVLMVEQAPRWEFQYLREMLLRERRIELQCFLADADPEVARVPGSPYIEEFPNRREDLFKYDLVIFGDVDPATVSDAQRDMLAAFVSEGGGSLIMLAGRRYNPASYRGSSLANLLPVDLKPTALGTGEAAATKPLLPVLTEAGKASPMLSLEDTEEANLTRWSELPPIYWIAAVERAKPAAEVLLAAPAGGTYPEGTPIIALQRYGTGEVLFVGTDNFWRWRKNTGDEFHTILWGQVIQRMAGRRLAVGDRKTDLKADKRTAAPGERITIFARLLGDDFLPRTDSTVRAVLEPLEGDGLPREVTLRGVPGTPGYYRAEFTAAEVGSYRLKLPGSGGGGDAATTGGGVDITVRSDDREFAETALNESLLREIAETTGGAFLREEDLHRLPSMLSVEPRTIVSAKEIELWASPLYFILLLIPLTLEWLLRKWSELK